MQERVTRKPQRPNPDRMVRKQILITPDQNRRLKARAAAAGIAEADIVRQGVEMALQAGQGAQDEWREGLDRLTGAWNQRNDMQDFVRGLREGGGRRLKRLGIVRERK